VQSIAPLDPVWCANVQQMYKAETDELNAIHAEWLTAEEAARYLRVKARTLLLWVRQGKIRGYPLSGIKRRVWRFRKADLDAALLSQNNSVLCSNPPSVLVMRKGEK
jgi:excisionase family DNA binding protein